METEVPKTTLHFTKATNGKSRSSLINKVASWLRVKKLERDLRASEKFQRQCNELNCAILAEFEEKYQAEVKARIQSLKEK